jgi:type I restriction enzyme S subunit
MEKVPIGEVAEVKSGFAFKSDDYLIDGIKLVRIGNLNGKNLVFNGENVCVSTKYISEYSDFLLKENDVLIAMSGATTGKLALVKKEDEPCLLNQRVGKFTVRDENHLNSKYLFYFLSNDSVKEGILKVSGGSAQPNVSPTQLKEVEIPLPDLKTQQKIARILEQADAARQKRKQANQLTEQFLQSVFLEMFGDPVRNEKEWRINLVEDISTKVSSGSTPLGGSNVSQDSGITFIRSQNVLMNKFDYSDVVFISDKIHDGMKRTWLKTSDVLINITGASIGRIAVYKGESDKANVNQHVCIIRTEQKKIDPDFLGFQISMQSFQDSILSKNSGATRQAFNFDQIKNFKIILPALPLQQKFASIVEQVEQLKNKQRESEKELENLFQSLMQRYFV